MALYEHVFLARQDISAQQVEQLIEQFKAIITEGGGTIGKIENWGLRTLAYRVNKNRKAHYTLMNIDAPHPAVAEMERQMRLNEDVLRFLTLRVDEHEEEQSAMMQKRDRDDRRRGRGDRFERDGGGRGDRGDRGGDRERGPRRQERENEE
ncbi:30S ribosomal protein S6 [Breoghania sp.]|uniref:30S ribosomal protein S6 n=1 Tax=Breoghania sp. TaxID=2065378 RepID=UPI002AA95134|nr:30S ribosomal protein S6 [Breoghania sp.]